MPISKEFTSVYCKKWEINFAQCAPNGYLKYTDLCHLLQLTAAAHSEIGGISFSDMQVHQQAWVLSRMCVEITALPKWKDEVTVKTWIVSLENSRSVRALEVYVGGVKLVGAETFWAVLNTTTRRPETLALPYSHFELFPNAFGTLKRVKKIHLPDDIAEISSKKVLLSDLDLVNHVNNVKYLEWCMDLLPPNEILNQKITRFDMNFMRELVWGDQFSIEICNNESYFFQIIKENKACFVLEIESESKE
ncbi:acyl-[acyl-carrier-protein] thioesterase [Flavobacterium branchiophilum]|uniref:Acyl-[acyl-carrier-protein] thioesterase n=1 Tax=Flavobacterium branchiophilum TaxID=55197 RepID=A0A2H3KMX8_9FLAO|nr:acyl-ACP thioesterase domain-containing protein [Flavobacterium branchiophilum]PDS24900.1 acyl-[acyl-carrier-protein] thioesterase [Flavobacterium branchiophilum]